MSAKISDGLFKVKDSLSQTIQNMVSPKPRLSRALKKKLLSLFRMKENCIRAFALNKEKKKKKTDGEEAGVNPNQNMPVNIPHQR